MEEKYTNLETSTHESPFIVGEILHHLQHTSSMDVPINEYLYRRLELDTANILYSNMFLQIRHYSRIKLGDVIHTGLPCGYGVLYDIIESFDTHGCVRNRYYRLYVTTKGSDDIYKITTLSLSENEMENARVFRIIEDKIVKYVVEDEEFNFESIVNLTKESKKAITERTIKEIENGIRDAAEKGMYFYDATNHGIYDAEIREHFEKLGFNYRKDSSGRFFSPKIFISWDNNENEEEE